MAERQTHWNGNPRLLRLVRAFAPAADAAPQRGDVMARRQTYLQCQLSKPVEGGVARMVSWIRSEIAVPGNLLGALEDTDTGRIETGWRVESASGPAMPEGVLLRQSRDHRRQRQASDI